MRLIKLNRLDLVHENVHGYKYQTLCLKSVVFQGRTPVECKTRGVFWNFCNVSPKMSNAQRNIHTCKCSWNLIGSNCDIFCSQYITCFPVSRQLTQSFSKKINYYRWLVLWPSLRSANMAATGWRNKNSSNIHPHLSINQ